MMDTTSAYNEVLKALNQTGTSGFKVNLACKWGARLVRRLVGLDFVSLTKEVWKVLNNPNIDKNEKDTLSTAYIKLIEAKTAQETAKNIPVNVRIQLYEQLSNKIKSRTDGYITPLPESLPLSFIDRLKRKFIPFVPSFQNTLKENNCVVVDNIAFDGSELEKLYQKELQEGFSFVVVTRSDYAKPWARIFTPRLIKGEIHLIQNDLTNPSDQKLLEGIQEQRRLSLFAMYPILSETLLLSQLGLSSKVDNLNYANNLAVLQKEAAEITDEALDSLKIANKQLKEQAKKLNIKIISPSPGVYHCSHEDVPNHIFTIKGLEKVKKFIHAESISQWLESNSIPYSKGSYYDGFVFKTAFKNKTPSDAPDFLRICLEENAVAVSYRDPFSSGSTMNSAPYITKYIRFDDDPITELIKIKESVDQSQTLLHHLEEIERERGNLKTDKLSVYKVRDQYFIQKKVGQIILEMELKDFNKRTIENKIRELEVKANLIESTIIPKATLSNENSFINVLSIQIPSEKEESCKPEKLVELFNEINFDDPTNQNYYNLDFLKDDKGTKISSESLKKGLENLIEYSNKKEQTEAKKINSEIKNTLQNIILRLVEDTKLERRAVQSIVVDLAQAGLHNRQKETLLFLKNCLQELSQERNISTILFSTIEHLKVSAVEKIAKEMYPGYTFSSGYSALVNALSLSNYKIPVIVGEEHSQSKNEIRINSQYAKTRFEVEFNSLTLIMSAQTGLQKRLDGLRNTGVILESMRELAKKDSELSNQLQSLEIGEVNKSCDEWLMKKGLIEVKDEMIPNQIKITLKGARDLLIYEGFLEERAI